MTIGNVTAIKLVDPSEFRQCTWYYISGSVTLVIEHGDNATEIELVLRQHTTVAGVVEALAGACEDIAAEVA